MKVCQWTNYFRYIDRSAAQPTSTAHLLHRAAAVAVRHHLRHLHRAAAAVLVRHRADHRGADHRHHHLGRVLHQYTHFWYPSILGGTPKIRGGYPNY